MNKIKEIINWIIIALLISIIIINFTLIIKSEINSDEIPDFLGYTPFIIVTGSMEPKIKTGNLIIMNKIKNKNELKVGDIISYKSKNENLIITHRINEIKNIEGIKTYIMKGDKNSEVDQEIITDLNIEGKYMYSIPFIGNIIQYFKKPIGILLILIIIILIYILMIKIRKSSRLKRTHIRRRFVRE